MISARDIGRDVAGGTSYGPPLTHLDVAAEYDACVIGSGASGAVVANALVTAGKSVLLLERGPFLPRDATEGNEGLADADAAMVPSDRGLEALGRPWTTCNVGGGTVFYAGVSFRPRRVDFDARAHFERSDLPVEWPFPYDELSSCFDAIEEAQGISGRPGDDPLYPDRQPDHVLPPLPRTPEGHALARAAADLGLHPFQTPLALLPGAYRDRAACEGRTACVDYRCPVAAKGDAYTVFLRPLVGHAALTLRAGCVATRLLRSRPDRVAAVEVRSVVDGQLRQLRARAFFVACNAIQSAALLLRSGDRWDGGGIGNAHDLVGRGLTMKLSEYCLGIAAEPVRTGRHVGPFSTCALTDYYLHPSCPSGMGGILYENHIEALEAPGAIVVEALAADAPRRRNRVTLAASRGRYGLPRVVIDYRTEPTDRARLAWLAERGSSWLRAAGAMEVIHIDTRFHLGSAHLHGTCRAGTNPRSSVVGPCGRVHGVDNLFVVDGAFMPFPTGVNPTPTIQANAYRIARDFLGSRCGDDRAPPFTLEPPRSTV